MNTRTRTLLSIAGVATLLLWSVDFAEKGEARIEARTAAKQADRSGDPAVKDRGPWAAPPPAALQSAGPPPADLAGVYVPDELRLRVVPGADPAAVAAEHGLRLLRPAGAAGMALVGLPAGADMAEVMADLGGDARVAGLGRNGRTYGAATEATPSLRAHQWHLDLMRVTDSPAARAAASGVVVAVLDSGAAYTAATEGGQAFAQAPGLAAVSVVSPYDFVEDDALPLDEHQHGTHIATAILGQGAALGVAPGAALMPLRVLNANNQGTELDLIDAIRWAADNGADLINLSLSFAPGYAPSQELRQELERAASMGVVIIGAAGNAGLELVTWPAASPHVLAVGAVYPKAGYSQVGQTGVSVGDLVDVADYSNTGAEMGILAPGGDLTVDRTGDGFVDGILAEAPVAGDPSQTGYYFMAGTSQAAALATGVAARLLAQGVPPGELAAVMRKGGWRANDKTAVLGYGGGLLDLGRATQAAALPLALDPTLRASAMGMVVKHTANKMKALVGVQLIDGDGDPISGAEVTVRARDNFGRKEAMLCTTGADGRCAATGLITNRVTNGAATPLSYAYEVVRVEGPLGDRVRPLGVFFATDGLEVITSAAEADPTVPTGHQLAIRWPAGTVGGVTDVLESTLLPSLGTGLSTSPIGVTLPGLPGLPPPPGTIGSFGTGLSTSPIGLVFNPPALTAWMAGTGLSTSPIGFAGVNAVTLSPKSLNLDGSGLSTSPIGLMSSGLLTLSSPAGSNTFLVVDGSGLSTSPIGFTGPELFRTGGGLNLQGVSLEAGVPVRASTDGYGALAGTTIGGRVAEGGFVDANLDLIGASVGSDLLVGASADLVPVRFE